MIEPESAEATEYERHWLLAVAARDAGGLDEADEHLAACMAVATANQDEELEERVLCARASIAFLRGEGDELIPRLCQIVLRNGSQVNGFLAANNVARACELRRDYRKGLFYARIARERATALGRPEWEATALNQIANLLLAESYFDQAAELYRQALARVPPEDGARQPVYIVNLGYCEIVLGNTRQGLTLLYSCLRRARRNRWLRLEMIASVDLCYAHLELGRLEIADRHGRRGLELAESIGEIDWVKNALYLLGEVAVLSGSASRGYAWFHELQHRFYPEQPHLPELLLAVDVRKLVNLRA